MAEIAELVRVREAFQIDNKVIPKHKIIHIIRLGKEGFKIYSKKGRYLGFVYNIPYENIPEELKPLNQSPI